MSREVKTRPVRPSALRAQQTFLNGNNSSDDDDTMEGNKPSRQNQRRYTRTDFLAKLEAASLHRYRKVYKLGDTPANTSKEDLIPSVARHFAQQVVDEEDVIVKFVMAVQRHSKQQVQKKVPPLVTKNAGVHKPSRPTK